MLRQVLRRLRRERAAAASPPAEEPTAAAPAGRQPQTILVDAHTRTFWARGAAAGETLVEAPLAPATESLGRRVAALAAAVPSGHASPAPRARSVGGPAFSEALFVELMREGRYERAYALLAPECQVSWGSESNFAARQVSSARESLLGVDVRSVRYLPHWTDPQRQLVHRDVAELDVAYTVLTGGRQTQLERTVHLVAVGGRWRSLCYPS
jgi:hypothetical protein